MDVLIGQMKTFHSRMVFIKKKWSLGERKKIMIKMIKTVKAVLARTTCQIEGGETREITATPLVIISNTDMMVTYSGK